MLAVFGEQLLIKPPKSVARIWFRGGHPFRGGGGRPPIFASDPKSQGSPLMYFWLPPDFGGTRPPRPPPPGYALETTELLLIKLSNCWSNYRIADLLVNEIISCTHIFCYYMRF